jgi:hypothetical protein
LSTFDKDSRYETHPAPSGAPERLLSPRERNRLFSKAGLSTALKGFDDVDRDVLLMRARSLNLEALKARYPKLPAQALSAFQALVHP